ncbi:MAG: DNA repair exonuclease [Pseudomonadota bacterium]
MTQRLIHSADWQLGRAFSGFGPDLGPQLRQARIDAIESLAELAREQGAEQVLVAGDVFDTETPSNATLLAALEAVGRAPGLTWRLLPGNHDPLATTGGGLWERVAREAPPNLRLHLEPRPEEIAPDLWLLPAPWPNKAPGRDLTAWMESAATPAGALRIGLAHGPTKRFGAAEAAGALSPPDRADSAGLAYLALGDWHGVQQAGPRAWYAGTPEPDRFPRNRPGCALVVAPRGPDAEPDVAAVGVARFDWRAPPPAPRRGRPPA